MLTQIKLFHHYINSIFNELNNCSRFFIVWGVAYDLWKCGYPLPESTKLFKARFDRIYVSGTEYNEGAREVGQGELRKIEDVLVSVRDTGANDMMMPSPNLEEASDHLPVMVEVNCWK